MKLQARLPATPLRASCTSVVLSAVPSAVSVAADSVRPAGGVTVCRAADTVCVSCQSGSENAIVPVALSTPAPAV